MNYYLDTIKKRKNSKKKNKIYVLVVILLFFITIGILYALFNNADDNDIQITINEGQLLASIAEDLEEKDVIWSKELFSAYMKLRDYDMSIKPMRYVFNTGEGMFAVAERITEGDGTPISIRLTFPEGSTNEEIAMIAKNNLEAFDENVFLEIAEQFEGYLFPETYFVSPTLSEDALLKILREEFTQKTSELLSTLSDEEKDEIIIMASIVEEEGKFVEDRKIIAGVLWNRLEMNMPLQVDAAFLKIPELDGRNTYELTVDDLAYDSPFNTYTNIGLPPSPLSNPGIESIEATLRPTESQYLFYVSERDGTTHFTETYDEHLDNVAKYL
jgi:UPF0755 protein